MNIVDPTWNLNKECPHCEQGDSLRFQLCEECHNFVLICFEELVEFEGIDPNELEYAREFSGMCRKCAGGHLRDVSSDEMHSLGFTNDDYH